MPVPEPPALPLPLPLSKALLTRSRQYAVMDRESADGKRAEYRRPYWPEARTSPASCYIPIEAQTRGLGGGPFGGRLCHWATSDIWMAIGETCAFA